MDEVDFVDEVDGGFFAGEVAPAKPAPRVLLVHFVHNVHSVHRKIQLAKPPHALLK